jgi:hypothetical protein
MGTKLPFYTGPREALASGPSRESNRIEAASRHSLTPHATGGNRGRDAPGREEDGSQRIIDIPDRKLRAGGYGNGQSTRISSDPPAIRWRNAAKPWGFSSFTRFPSLGQVFLYFPIHQRRFTLSYLM